MAKEAGRSLGFDPSVLLDGPVDTRLSEALAADLLSTLREALSNVVRHANAQHVQVEVSVDRGVELRVVDDGVGPPAEGAGAGNGLRNMAARAERRGGTMDLSAGADGGTVLTWTVPLD
jgi:signal transduction histidine kinase